MRIIFLNSWEGKVGNKYFEFFRETSSKTDFFCLSEITPELHKNLEGLLVDYRGYFAHQPELTNSLSSQTIFVKKNYQVQVYKKELLYEAIKSDAGQEVPGYVLGMTLNNFSIFNVQGMAYPGHKLDTELRLKQSKQILKFASQLAKPHIIMGDFNLLPNTKSVSMFEEVGYKNLIKYFKITTTRNDLADHTKNDKQYFGKQHFADYCFVSPEVKVLNFEVPNVEVSDHLPLILDFEI